MNFTVKHQAGRYVVVSDIARIGDNMTECGIFDEELEAQEEAKRLNEEYERVLSFL